MRRYSCKEGRLKRRMMRNCSLELKLFPPSTSSEFMDFPSQSVASSSTRDQITIFHNIQSACVCDAIDLQAIVILWLARRKLEDKFNFTTGEPTKQFQLHVPSGLSLKRSLRRFLQKRKDRIQSAIPYKHTLH